MRSGTSNLPIQPPFWLCTLVFLLSVLGPGVNVQAGSALRYERLGVTNPELLARVKTHLLLRELTGQMAD